MSWNSGVGTIRTASIAARWRGGRVGTPPACIEHVEQLVPAPIGGTVGEWRASCQVTKLAGP